MKRDFWSSEKSFEVGRLKEIFGAQKRVLKLEGDREIWSSEESFEFGR